uniref:Uncharacterized protein n=1 Tax=Anguilla anguilla TaxID=7936 RepID=A0A0E9WX49_ANGAN
MKSIFISCKTSPPNLNISNYRSIFFLNEALVFFPFNIYNITWNNMQDL